MKKENNQSKRVTHFVDPVIIEENANQSNTYSKKYKPLLKKFATRFNEELELKGFSQEQFAETINTSTGALSNYRTGKRLPESKLLYDIAEELHVSLDYLFGLTDLKSRNLEYKKINEITGLTDDSIKQLKEYVDFINAEDSIEEIKNVIKDKLRVINFLISQEENNHIFHLIAEFLWCEYESNFEDILYKKIDKNLLYKDDYEFDKKFNGDSFLINVANRANTHKSFKLEDINKLNFFLIEEQLNKLKEKYNDK